MSRINDERWQAEKAAARKRNADAYRERRAHKPVRVTTITWLPEPVRLVPGKRIMVVGITSDCALDVAAAYGVKL